MDFRPYALAGVVLAVALTAPACGKSGDGTPLSSRYQAAPAPAPATLAEEVAALAARVPDDVDDVLLMWPGAAVHEDASEGLMVLAATLLAELPVVPDELVMHGVTQGMHDFLLQGDHDVADGKTLTWYDGWKLSGLPRAYLARVKRHQGFTEATGCEGPDGDAPRTARGVALHGDEGALMNTVCVDAAYRIRAAGEYAPEVAARIADGALGKSAAAALLQGLPLDAPGTWAAFAWVDSPTGPYAADRVTLTARASDAGTQEMTLRVHAKPGKKDAIEAALRFEGASLGAAARALASEASVDADEDWISVRFVLSEARRKATFDAIPDSLRAHELILAREAARGATP